MDISDSAVFCRFSLNYLRGTVIGAVINAYDLNIFQALGRNTVKCVGYKLFGIVDRDDY